jgi:soluble lytic murein transglycosylase-like protein
MVCLSFRRRTIVSTVALASAAAPCLFGLSTPALAHARRHASAHEHHHHHLVRYLVRREAMPGADSFAYGINYGAAAPQWAPQSWRGWNAWREDSWEQRERSWAPSENFGALDGMATAAASEAGVPASLVERVIARESGGNPRAVSRGNYGLMQIRLGTARAMGYAGSAAGLLDPQTNMTYAVRYLAGAYRAAGGNESRAVALYARGYNAAATAQNFSPYAPNFSPYAADSGFNAYGVAAQPQGFVRDYQTAAAMPGPFYDYAAPVHRLRYRRHRAV